MFFESLPVEPDALDPRVPDVPPWSTPPPLELGSVVAVERTVARSANVVIVLPTIRAFSAGCLFNIEVVGRQGTLSADEWWDLRLSGQPIHPVRSRGDDLLPDKLLRLGVRYASGAKATTIEGTRLPFASPEDPPTGPVLSWIPGGSGGGRRAGGEFMLDYFALWLWPLPPAEKIEFAVEWPFGGIDLTLVELDGAAIVSAAERSVRLWPDP
jgi:hypothetical protein